MKNILLLISLTLTISNSFAGNYMFCDGHVGDNTVITSCSEVLDRTGDESFVVMDAAINCQKWTMGLNKLATGFPNMFSFKLTCELKRRAYIKAQKEAGKISVKLNDDEQTMMFLEL